MKSLPQNAQQGGGLAPSRRPPSRKWLGSLAREWATEIAIDLAIIVGIILVIHKLLGKAI